VFVTFKSPFSLQNWTMPVIELVLVAGAIACLIHAVRRRRRHGDSSNLVVWISGAVSVLLMEPVAYFPQWFGAEQSLGLTIVHNQFSVQFFYERLPLYIVAMYPVYTYVAYVLVQRTGIFQRYNAVVGATCVAFVYHCLYEVVDTVAVQFRWWVWNEELPSSRPALGVVPYVNLQAFGLGLPFALTLVTLLLSTRANVGGWTVARNAVVVSLLNWPIQFLFSGPATVIDLAGASIETGRLIATWLLIVSAGVVTAVAFTGAYLARRRDPDVLPVGVGRDYFALWCVLVYLPVVAAMWIAALPDYLDAYNGRTPAGAPVGSLPYAIITLVLSAVLTTTAYVRTTTAHGSRATRRNATTARLSGQ
jgi:hypothetical protein